MILAPAFPRLWVVPALLGLGLAGPVPGSTAAAAVDSPGIAVVEATLDNGVRLLVVPREGSLTVAAGWTAEAGSASDPASAPGLAHLLEHLLLQGTSTVGVRDRVREAVLIEREEALRERLRTAWRGSPELSAVAFDPDGVARALGREEELRRIRREASSLAVQGELALLYDRASAEGRRDVTFEDFALSTARLPPEALELWFWLESDRLRDPVFRQLDRELRVVREERRRELADDPARGLDEALRRGLWGEHPYGRPVAGSPEDLSLLSREEIRGFFRERYRPSSLTVALVGAVDPTRARVLAEAYFGRLSGAEAPPHVDSPEPRSPEDGGPIEVGCEGRPRAALVFPAPAFAHPDRPAVELLAAVLNGRTGRLHRRLAAGDGPVWAAWAVHRPLARGGELWLRAELRPGADPLPALEALEDVAREIVGEPVPADELDRARDRLRAETYRGLREPTDLLTRLLAYEALGESGSAIEPEAAWVEITPERLREAAARVFGARPVAGLCPGSSR